MRRMDGWKQTKSDVTAVISQDNVNHPGQCSTAASVHSKNQSTSKLDLHFILTS